MHQRPFAISTWRAPRRSLFAAALYPLLVATCIGCGSSAAPGKDGALADVAPADLRAEASILDGATADLGLVDAALPDAPLPDAPLPDATMPDAPAADAPAPDATLPDLLPPTNSHALAFDGSDDHVRVAHDVALSDLSALTVEAWVKPAAPPASAGEGWVLGKIDPQSSNGSAYRLYRSYVYPTSLRGSVSGTSSGCKTNSGASLTNGTWTHVALTWSKGSPVKIYGNGQLVYTSSCTLSQLKKPLGPLLIGAGHTSGTPGRFWVGAIDEVRIWSVTRTAQQIQGSMSSKLAGNEAGLVAYWPFDEGSGDQAADASGGGHVGQLGSQAGPDPADPSWISDTPF